MISDLSKSVQHDIIRRHFHCEDNIYRGSFTILVLLVNFVPMVIIYYISIVSSVSIKINLFSSWYSWKIAELALNNNHLLTIKAILFTQKQLFDWLLNMNCIRKYFSTSFSLAIHKYAVFTSWYFSNNVSTSVDISR